MKNIILILLLFAVKSNAQEKEDPDKNKIDFSSFSTKSILLPKPDTIIIPGFTVNDIVVLDNRFDTSTLGFMQKDADDRKRFIKCKNGDTKAIHDYIFQTIHPAETPTDTAGHSLVCIIQKLWLSDILNNSREPAGNRKVTEPKSGIMIRLDFLVKKSQDCKLLYQFDTTMAYTKKSVSGHVTEYLANALSHSLRKLGQTTTAIIEKKKKVYNWSQIIQYTKKKFDIPILLDTPRRGVYVTFTEFRNNTPSIKEFTIVPDKKNDDVYVKDKDGKEVLLSQVFGYSDGQHIYIRSSENFFKLYRSGNTYNLYGAKSLRKVSDIRWGENAIAGAIFGAGSPDIMLTPRRDRPGYVFKLRHYPLQLDMETGDVY